MSSRTPTKIYGSESCNSSCRFCKIPFHSNSSTVPVFSTTQRKGYEGLQLSSVLSGFGIFVEKDAMSSRSCLTCARRIFSSCKILSEIKEALKSMPRQLSVKRLANSSPSAAPNATGDAGDTSSVQGRSRKKLSWGKENLPPKEKESIDQNARLEEEIQSLMSIPVEETKTITKVIFVINLK